MKVLLNYNKIDALVCSKLLVAISLLLGRTEDYKGIDSYIFYLGKIGKRDHMKVFIFHPFYVRVL